MELTSFARTRGEQARHLNGDFDEIARARDVHPSEFGETYRYLVRFASFVIDEVQLGQTHQHGLAVPHFDLTY